MSEPQAPAGNNAPVPPTPVPNAPVVNNTANNTPVANNTPPVAKPVTKEEVDEKGIVGTANDRLNERSKQMVTGTIVFAIIWVTLGLAGFITSFVCLGKEGDLGIKIGGIMLALFLGPFYWIYFGVFRYQKKYCMPKPK